MNPTVEKQVHIAESRAKRLEELAAERGATEDMLIEEGLDLLFMKQSNRLAREVVEEEDRQLLARLEAETGPVPCNTRPIHKIDRNEIVSIIGTRIDSRRLRRCDE